jgi:hypothetical protein
MVGPSRSRVQATLSCAPDWLRCKMTFWLFTHIQPEETKSHFNDATALRVNRPKVRETLRLPFRVPVRPILAVSRGQHQCMFRSRANCSDVPGCCSFRSSRRVRTVTHVRRPSRLLIQVPISFDNSPYSVRSNNENRVRSAATCFRRPRRARSRPACARRRDCRWIVPPFRAGSFASAP